MFGNNKKSYRFNKSYASLCAPALEDPMCFLELFTFYKYKIIILVAKLCCFCPLFMKAGKLNIVFIVYAKSVDKQLYTLGIT